MCGSKRPGRGCTSAKCVNDDEDEAPQTIVDDDADESLSEPCSLRPYGSSEDSPPATDDGRLADEKLTEDIAQSCLSRNPSSSRRRTSLDES